MWNSWSITGPLNPYAGRKGVTLKALELINLTWGWRRRSGGAGGEGRRSGKEGGGLAKSGWRKPLPWRREIWKANHAKPLLLRLCGIWGKSSGFV